MASLVRIVAALASLSLAGCAGNSAAAQGVVNGAVSSAPTCPVERISSPCAPRAVAGAAVAALQGTRVVTSTHTDTRGHFELHLTYGHYTIRATNVGGLATTASQDVDVSAQPVSIDLTVDSGIR